MRYRAASASCLMLGALAGCASDDYTYVPEQNIALVASPENAKEISYPIWKGPKEGNVQVSFVGLKDLELKKGDPKIRAAQVRLTVKNDTEHDWTIDTSRCQLEIPGHGKDKAEYVATKGGAAPSVDVRAGATQVVDFYYPLPEDLKKSKELPAFGFEWQVRAKDKTIAQTTKFARVRAEDVAVQPAYPAYPYGYGMTDMGYPYWWYDPMWAPYPYYGGGVGVSGGVPRGGAGAGGGRMMPPKR